MRLYMTPGSCTIGIHVLLEEIDEPFDVAVVNLPAGDNRKPEYLAINPKGTIPTLLRKDGTALTEFQAIAWWLGRKFPRAKLIPADIEGEAQAIQAMDYCVGAIHMQGYTRIFTTDKYTDDPAKHEAIQAQGREIVAKGFAVMNDVLAGKDYVCGDFSIADAALFYVEFWADKIGLPLPDNCRAHYERMRARPAVSRVLREEGYR